MPRTQTIKDLVIENLKIEKDLIVAGNAYGEFTSSKYDVASNGAEMLQTGPGLTDFNFNKSYRDKMANTLMNINVERPSDTKSINLNELNIRKHWCA